MSNFNKCDFCKREIKWMTSFYRFEMSYSNCTDKKAIDVCNSCYKKFVKSVKTEVVDDLQTDNEESMKNQFIYCPKCGMKNRVKFLDNKPFVEFKCPCGETIEVVKKGRDKGSWEVNVDGYSN